MSFLCAEMTVWIPTRWACKQYFFSSVCSCGSAASRAISAVTQTFFAFFRCARIAIRISTKVFLVFAIRV